MRHLAIFLVLCFPLLWTGCRSGPEENEATRIAKRLVNQIAAIEPLGAHAEGHRIFVKYRGVQRDGVKEALFHASAEWEPEPESNPERPMEIIIPLSFHEPLEWEESVKGLAAIPVYGPGKWVTFQENVLNPLIPENPNEGIMVAGDPGYLCYRDAENRISVLGTEDVLKSGKIPDVRIVKTYSPRELATLGVKTLRKQFEEEKNPALRVLFATGRTRNDSGPFVYIDLEAGIALQLRLKLAKERTDTNAIMQNLEVGQHVLINSTLMATVSNPISTMNRLFFLTTQNLYDLATPAILPGELQGPLPPVNEGPGMDLEAWEETLDELTGTVNSSGTIEFLIDGDEFFGRFYNALMDAKKSVDIRIFVFDRDDFAVRIADLLKLKSKDTDVRVLLDGLGTKGEGAVDSDTLPSDLNRPGSIISYLRDGAKVSVRVQNNPFMTADHVKTIIMDRDYAFTGGMNIGREYRYEWHDMMMEVRGSVVGFLDREFQQRWRHAGIFGDVSYFFYTLFSKDRVWPETEDMYPIRILQTTASRSDIYKAQIRAIRESRKYIYLENPYFSDDSVLVELIKARRRGVDVRVIVPLRGNHELMARSNFVTANVMFQNGIRVFVYPRMSHVKASIYDGWACTGTANFDKLSFHDNLELNLATSHPATVEMLLERLFLPDFERSYEMTELLPTDWVDYLAEKLADRL